MQDIHIPQEIVTQIILVLLSLDTIRALIAMTGWVKPDAKLSWIIYGRYERNLMAAGLKELGFEEQRGEVISDNIRKVPKEEEKSHGITRENAAEKLIILISKYIVYFDRPIQYGGSRTTTSSYYIDTMEMSHNERDRKKMEAIMAHLYAKKGKKSKPEVIVTPKGGNPLFAQSVANHYGSSFVVAKSSGEKSRITSITDEVVTYFKINYEGSWNVLNSHKNPNCILVDCNTSGGSQLIEIVDDLHEISQKSEKITIPQPTEAYVLFRADNEVDIDSKFKDHSCKLYRFFDLDEDIKKQIYQLKESVGEGREPDLYFPDDKRQVDRIISCLKEKNLFFYSKNEKKESKKIPKSEEKTAKAKTPSTTTETSNKSK